MAESADSQPAEAANPNAIAPTISFDDFAKIDLRTAKVLAAEPHPNADRLLKLTIKVGQEERTLCAGIKQWYAPEDLVGKTIVVVANLEPRKLRGVMSQGMLLAVQDGDGDVVPLTVMKEAVDGLRVS
ncbi:MAG: methionine--tRNA ligase subunit beta [Planctomycetes bacterium]|nr:methionine--tRNA ligase subunit beta [Planctomycetota bacterium]